MTSTLVTVTLLIVASCNVMTLGLYLDQKRRSQRQTITVLDAVAGVRNHLTGITRLLNDDGTATRRRIAEVKTRLADEERDDKQAKARARRSRQKGRQ